MREPATTIVFQPWGRRCRAAAGTTLLEAAQANGVGVASGCGGVGTCGDCAVRVVTGEVTPPSDDESRLVGDERLAAGFRLACTTRLLDSSDDVLIDVPTTSRVEDHPSQTDAVGIDPLPAIPGAERQGPLGVAIDIGTTGLATYLVGLDSGGVLAAHGAPNPQISYGEDVMSRLAVALTDPARTERMRRVLADELDRLIGELCDVASVSRDDVVRAVVVGNTAMHHLFFGLPVATLAWAPYEPADASERTVPAESVGLRLAPGATVSSPAIVAGFVGSDHVAMLLAAGADAADLATAYLDVGTNTEISVVARGQHWCCSAASGPAFEGAHIGAGMRAANGAIDSVRMGPDGLSVTTIGGTPAIGICGSGLLDAVAVLHREGALTGSGALRAGHPLVVGSGRAAQVTLTPGFDSRGPVALSRRDIGEVQMAKAAVRAGLKLLTEAAGIEEDDLEQIVLAGAFGTRLDPGSAREIGLIPARHRGIVRQIGNGAGAGACRLLADPARCGDAERLVLHMSYLELTGHPGFQNRFTQALSLDEDPWDS